MEQNGIVAEVGRRMRGRERAGRRMRGRERVMKTAGHKTDNGTGL